MHYLCGSHIVDAPRIGHPVACRNGMVVGFCHTEMGNVRIDILRSLKGLFGCTGSTVDGGIDTPDGRMVMQAFQSHAVFVFCPYAFVLQPQSLVHSCQDSCCFSAIGFGIFADDLGDTRCQQVATIVVG